MQLENAQLFTLCLSNSDIMKADDMDFEHPLTPFHGPDSEGALRIHSVDVCAKTSCGDVCCGLLRVWNFEDNIVEFRDVWMRLDMCLHASVRTSRSCGFADRLRLMNVLAGVSKWSVT